MRFTYPINYNSVVATAQALGLMPQGPGSCIKDQGSGLANIYAAIVCPPGKYKVTRAPPFLKTYFPGSFPPSSEVFLLFEMPFSCFELSHHAALYRRPLTPSCLVLVSVSCPFPMPLSPLIA